MFHFAFFFGSFCLIIIILLVCFDFNFCRFFISPVIYFFVCVYLYFENESKKEHNVARMEDGEMGRVWEKLREWKYTIKYIV